MAAVTQVAPIPQLPQVTLPVPRDPPVLTDITNMNSFREKASKQKRQDDNAITDEDMAHITINEHKVSD